MPKGIYVRKLFTEKHCKNMSEAQKRRPPRSPLSKEHRRKLSEITKGRHHSPKSEFKKGIIPWNKGKSGVLSIEVRQQLSKLAKNRIGDKASNWKGGISFIPQYNAVLESRRRAHKRNNGGEHSIVEWTDKKKQFNFICPACFRPEPDIKLTQDHIIPLKLGGSDDISNIQPLCLSCNSRKKIKIIYYANAQRKT